MLDFFSAINEMVNSKAAMKDAISTALADRDRTDCCLIIFHTTMGHKYSDLLSVAREMCPEAEVVGCTGCGVIGKDGVSEKMRALAVMVITGEQSDFEVSHRDDLTYENSYETARSAAEEIKEKNPGVNMLNILASGMDIVADQAINGIESVFGQDVPLFGGTASDNVKAITSFQSVGDNVMEHGLVLVGFADPSLEVVMGVHHGNIPVGDDFEITCSDSNRIKELNGEAAWPFIMKKIEKPVDTSLEEALRLLCFGTTLPDELQKEYDNEMILSVPFRLDEEKKTFYTPVSVMPGTRLCMVQRDETKMFEGLKSLLERLVGNLNGRRPVAVFHTDCAARGRLTFNVVAKNEIIANMQIPLFKGEPVAWLGLYGFGEFARLGNRNYFHNQTTSLYIIVKKQ